MPSLLHVSRMAQRTDLRAGSPNRANAIAVQLCSYSINVMLKTMPSEFLKALKDSALPLNNLLKGIYNYSKNNNLSDLPNWRDVDFPISEPNQ